MQDFFDALENKAFIWRKMAKHKINSLESALRLRYNLNSSF